MGSFGKKGKDASKKKKGPKGKKARAKAKLEKQWGEVAVQGGTTSRIGKSRLAARTQQREAFQNRSNGNEKTADWGQSRHREYQKQQRHKRPAADTDSSSISEDDSSSDEDPVGGFESDRDDEVDAAKPLNDLLSMIRKSKTKIKKRHQEERMKGRVEEEDDEDDDDDDDKSERSGSGSSSEDEDSLSSDDGCMDQDEPSAVSVKDDAAFHDVADDSDRAEIFRQRFCRQPLSQEELQSFDTLAKSSQKIPIDSQNSFDLQVSTPVVGISDMEDLLSLKTNNDWQQKAEETFSTNTKAVLQRQWKRIQRKKHQRDEEDDKKLMDNVQAPLYSFLARYSDMFVTTGNSDEKHARREQRDIHRMYLLHILNHVLSSQSRTSNNNKLLNEAEKKREKEEDDGVDANMDEEEDSDNFRDQGFTRPKVLILLPTRGTCHKLVKDLYRLLGSQIDQEQEERFEADYGPIIEPDDEEEH
ncbi:MAG: hypothetical protein SGARI_001363, partial [Bacillariaceae sp.]